MTECKICRFDYLAKAHHNHCPVCGSAPMHIAGRSVHVNVVTGREIIRPGWNWVTIKDIIESKAFGTAARLVKAVE